MEQRTAKRADYWRDRISEQERSGLGVQGFCKEHGLTQGSYSWRKRLRKQPPMRFASVESGPAGRRSGIAADLEMVLGTGKRLRISSGVEPALLRTVLDILRA